MNSRVHPNYKTQYRVTNWPSYDRALVQRGDITMWISEDAIDAWAPRPSRKRGGQSKYSDTAIETALTLRAGVDLIKQVHGKLTSKTGGRGGVLAQENPCAAYYGDA